MCVRLKKWTIQTSSTTLDRHERPKYVIHFLFGVNANLKYHQNIRVSDTLIIFSRHNKYKRYDRSLVTLQMRWTEQQGDSHMRKTIDDHKEKIVNKFLFPFFILFKVSLPDRLERNPHAYPNIKMEVWVLVQWAKIEKVCTSYMLNKTRCKLDHLL